MLKNLILIILILLIPGTAAADVTYRDHIDIHPSDIDVQITEIYTGDDYAIVQGNLADDRSAFIQRSKDGITTWSSSYIIIDDDPSLLQTKGVDVDVDVSDSLIVINSTLKYSVAVSLDCSRHSIWIQGHPAIDERTIILPENVDMESIAGIKDSSTMKEDGRIMITGASTTRKFMNNNRTTFEYATVVSIYKKPMYAQPWFLPLLAAIEFSLIGVWWTRRKTQ